MDKTLFDHSAYLLAVQDEESPYCGADYVFDWEDKHVYVPVLKDEFWHQPPTGGQPVYILVDENGDAEWYTDELFSLTDKAQTEPADFTEGETPESKAQEEEDEDDPYVVYQSYHNEVNKQLFFSAGGRDGEFPGKFTPTHVEELEDNQIFVFGSNKDGENESGTANRAFATFGAEWGVGEGLTGKCYAIPTKDGLLTMAAAVKRFIDFAAEHPDLEFLVTPLGCGTAGHNPLMIAPMFQDAVVLPNVRLPRIFWEYFWIVNDAGPKEFQKSEDWEKWEK